MKRAMIMADGAGISKRPPRSAAHAIVSLASRWCNERSQGQLERAALKFPLVNSNDHLFDLQGSGTC